MATKKKKKAKAAKKPAKKAAKKPSAKKPAKKAKTAKKPAKKAKAAKKPAKKAAAKKASSAAAGRAGGAAARPPAARDVAREEYDVTSAMKKREAIRKKLGAEQEFRRSVLLRELEIYRSATRELAEWLAAARRGDPPSPA